MYMLLDLGRLALITLLTPMTDIKFEPMLYEAFGNDNICETVCWMRNTV